jgi:methyl-accepting chemotaxis protein
MIQHWTFGRKLGGGFAVTVAALIVIAVFGYRSAKIALDADGWVSHTHEVRRELAELLADLVDAETGQRGFIITGNEEFLEPYRTSLSKIDRVFGQVHELTIDNPRQTRRLDAARPVISTRLDVLKQGIDRRRASSVEDTAQWIAKGDGKVVMDQLRAMIGEMDADELNLLQLRRDDAASNNEMTKLVIIGGSAAAVILTVIVGVLLTTTLTSQVGSAAQHIQSSSTELQAAATQQATGAREQSSAMTEVATTISELLATSRQIADSAKRVSQIAGQTATTSRTGELTVAKGLDASTVVRKQVDVIVGHMLELGKKSQAVGVVLDIVGELAEQTNILAINATIEAAGAGESGRRFGVVADEIRKLADRVASSTKEIRGMVEDVRGAVNTAVMATEAGSKAVDAGAAQVAEVAVAFREISNLVVTTTDAAREIELSTKQQATAVEQVNLAITTVASATRENASSANQTQQTAAQLTELSTSLLKIVHTKAG